MVGNPSKNGIYKRACAAMYICSLSDAPFHILVRHGKASSSFWHHKNNISGRDNGAAILPRNWKRLKCGVHCAKSIAATCSSFSRVLFKSLDFFFTEYRRLFSSSSWSYEDRIEANYKFNVEMEKATIEYSVGLIMANNSARTGDWPNLPLPLLSSFLQPHSLTLSSPQIF